MTIAPPPRFERYVALGDSSTAGIDDPDQEGGYRGWSQRLAEKIYSAQDSLLYANLAVRGLKTAEVRAGQLEPALAMKPDLATLFCGTNDVTGMRFNVDQVAADLEHMQRALVASGATVLCFNLPDLTPIMPLARLVSARVAALNRALTVCSSRTGAILVDFAAQPVASDRRLWSEDRIHANSAGHTRIAEALAQALSIPGSSDSWKNLLPKMPAPTPRTRWAAELHWTRRHLLPWIWEGFRNAKPTEERRPKRPSLTPL